MEKKKNKYIRNALIIAFSVVMLQIIESAIKSYGYEFRTFLQVIKGIYVWLVGPVWILILCIIQIFGKLEKKHPVIEKVLIGAGILAICIIGFGRGVFYVFTSEFVEETMLEEQIIEGKRSEFLEPTKKVYYESVMGVLRKPFSGWTRSRAEEILQEKYGSAVTILETYAPERKEGEEAEQEYWLCQAVTSRNPSEEVMFLAKKDYYLSDNLGYQLLLADGEQFWANRNRKVSFKSLRGEEFSTENSLEKNLILYVWCGGIEDAALCAGDLADWIMYAKKEPLYKKQPMALMQIGIESNEDVFFVYADWIKEDGGQVAGWEDIQKEIREELEQEFENRKKQKQAKEEMESQQQEKDYEEDSFSEEEWAARFLETYDKEYYEKECILEDGKTVYRMVVLDAALGSRMYGLLKSTDGGETFQVASRDPFGGSTGMGIDFTFLNETKGFATLMHNGGASADLYITEDGGLTYQPVSIQGESVTLDDGYTYTPYDYPEMPYEKDGLFYVEVGQGDDGDYAGGNSAGKPLFISKDGGHTFQKDSSG